MERSNPRACPACGNTQHFRTICTSPVFRYKGNEIFEVARCDRCDLVMTFPRLSWNELQTYYPNEYYAERSSVDNPRTRKPTHGGHMFDPLTAPDTLLDDLPSGKMLEIGCGTGESMAYMAHRNWECLGIEPSNLAADIAEDRYGLSVYNDRFENVSLDQESFDLILLDNVLEHLYDPFKTLERCAGLLRPDGVLVVEVPNIESLGFWLFGRYWADLDVPRHLFHFSPSVLIREAEQYGFDCDRLSFSGYPLTLRHSLNRVLAQKKFPSLGRPFSAILLPLSLAGKLTNRGTRMRIRFSTGA